MCFGIDDGQLFRKSANGRFADYTSSCRSLRHQDPSACQNFRVRFGHFKHCMAEFFMWKLAANPPAVAFIEVNGPNVRLDHAKAKRFVSATAYLALRLCQQSSANSKPAGIISHPQITYLFFACHCHADDLLAQDC